MQDRKLVALQKILDRLLHLETWNYPPHATIYDLREMAKKLVESIIKDGESPNTGNLMQSSEAGSAQESASECPNGGARDCQSGHDREARPMPNLSQLEIPGNETK
jgi:hypothetical protein